MSLMQLMMQFQAATRAAIARTGDESISTNIKNGKVQICSVVFDKKGRSTVTPITEHLPPEDALQYLNNMGV